MIRLKWQYNLLLVYSFSIYYLLFQNQNGFSWDSFADSSFGYAPAQEIIMDISFEEAVRGMQFFEKNVKRRNSGAQKSTFVNMIEDCIKCDGSGTEPGYKKAGFRHFPSQFYYLPFPDSWEPSTFFLFSYFPSILFWEVVGDHKRPILSFCMIKIFVLA